MKCNFLLLGLFMSIGITNLYATALYEDQGSVSGGGIMGIKAQNMSINPANKIQILSLSGEEIDCIVVDNFEHYIQNLAPGEYILVCIDDKGRTIYQTLFLVE